jgi:mannose-1-phosphate guanylyltransferase
VAAIDAAVRLGGAPAAGGARVGPREGRTLVKAVVLVGGEGTRLRPLTETLPKPLVPLVDRPSLDHVLDHLVRHGVHEVVMSSPYLEATFHPFIESRRGDPSITWITEPEPLGTGGAIVHARDALGSEPFFALNGDIVTDLDLTAMLELHRTRKAWVTIALHHVDDARPFGLIESDSDGRILAFREKPAAAVPGDVNAGTYVIDPEALRPWATSSAISIEREIFPGVIDAGHPVYGFAADAYWLDLGTPEKYLQAHHDLLEGRLRGISYAAPWIAPDARVDAAARLGRWVAVGSEAVVAADAELDDSVVHAGALVGAGARILRSVLGPRSVVGPGAVVVDSVLGEGSRVHDRSELHDARIAAGGEAPG